MLSLFVDVRRIYTGKLPANVFASEFFDIGFQAFAVGEFRGPSHRSPTFIVFAELVPNDAGVKDRATFTARINLLIRFLPRSKVKFRNRPLVLKSIKESTKCTFFDGGL